MSVNRMRESSPDSNVLFRDVEFRKNNEHISRTWISIRELYPEGCLTDNQKLLPDELASSQFGQGIHYECFMNSALAVLVRTPHVIRRCFLTSTVRQDGRYTFQFFRGKTWVKLEIDDTIALEDGEILYIQSPTHHWWPLLLEKAYAKFYKAYDHLEGCTLQEAFHDLTGFPVLNIPTSSSVAVVGLENGEFWLDMAEKIGSGAVVVSALTSDVELEKAEVGLQPLQQYGVVEIFSLEGGMRIKDIVVELFNPFEDEEYAYVGPLNPRDSAWSDADRERLDVDNPSRIYMPLPVFLKLMVSMQVCQIAGFEKEVKYFDGEWRGSSAGGNPTCASWRKNPMFLVENTTAEHLPVMAMLKHEDARHLQREPQYPQCGLILAEAIRSTACDTLQPKKLPTFFITGNNHRVIGKSLFINSRDNAASFLVPPHSLCYLSPCGFRKGVESPFTIALYFTKKYRYNGLKISPLQVPEMNWSSPIEEEIELLPRTKDRLDFCVSDATDVHILMRQTLPFVCPKNGGDAVTTDYLGLYLYDDKNVKVGGVHAATNFRETSIVQHLYHPGRYALSITCPQSKGNVPAIVSIVVNRNVQAQFVETLDNAEELPQEEEIVEQGNFLTHVQTAIIDFSPARVFVFPNVNTPFTEDPEDASPFEDRRFVTQNHHHPDAVWMRITELYPQEKNDGVLLPEKLLREHFRPGRCFQRSCLNGLASLVERHDDIIRHCFVTKHIRRDGRYTFQFYRYGEWVKVEVDDRIPVADGEPLYCTSPTGHWWPLLLEKAYAKFYSLYQNLEGLPLHEWFYDVNGCGVAHIPVKRLEEEKNALTFWDDLKVALESGDALVGCISVVQRDAMPTWASALGLQEGTNYAVLDIVDAPTFQVEEEKALLSTEKPLVLKLYDACLSRTLEAKAKDEGFAATALSHVYSLDVRALYANTEELQKAFPAESGVVYLSIREFGEAFKTLQKGQFSGGVEGEVWRFRSEWGKHTSGGSPNLASWFENPMYVLKNDASSDVVFTALISQPDLRHSMRGDLGDVPIYPPCCTIVSRTRSDHFAIPTYLLTDNTHELLNSNAIFMPQRETFQSFTIPAQSMCYLVPCTALPHEGLFQLNLKCSSDVKNEVSITRLALDKLNREAPAVAEVSFEEGQNEAHLMFTVETPTEAHILVQQRRLSAFKGEEDEGVRMLRFSVVDANGVSVYNSIMPTACSRAGVVTSLPDAGRYTFLILCEDGEKFDMEIQVSIVCFDEAHVRLIDTSVGAGTSNESLGDSKTEEEKEEAKLDALDSETELANKSAEKEKDTTPLPAPWVEVTPSRRNGLFWFLKEEYLGIPREDIDLQSNEEVCNQLRLLEEWSEDANSHASQISEGYQTIEELALEIAEKMHEEERQYLPSEPNGVPLDLLPLNEDLLFSTMEDELRAANRAEVRDSKRIKEYEKQLIDRALALALEIKLEERNLFLDPMPGGVPAEQLALDEDEEFHSLEVQRLELRIKRMTRSSGENRCSIARHDPGEHAERDETATELETLNEKLNNRAEQLALEMMRPSASFLDEEYLCVGVGELPVDTDAKFLEAQKESTAILHRKDDAINTEEQRAELSQAKLYGAFMDLAARMLHQWRPAYLHKEYLGWHWEDLPLNESEPLLQLEKQRRHLMRSNENTARTATETNIHRTVLTIAEAKTAKERLVYLQPSYRGVPIEDLVVQNDKEMSALEVQRARLMCDPENNAARIKEAEEAMQKRAIQLAGEYLLQSYSFLERWPCGVLLDLLAFLEDEEVKPLWEERAALLNNEDSQTERVQARISALETTIRDRVVILAENRKAQDRSTLLVDNATHITHDELTLDTESLFTTPEHERYLLVFRLTELPESGAEREREEVLESIREKEEKMIARFTILAKAERQRRRRLLLGGSELYGISLQQLPLNDDLIYAPLERQHDDITKTQGLDTSMSLTSLSHKRMRLESQLQHRARQLARAVVFADAVDLLNPTPSGVPLEELDPLVDSGFLQHWEVYLSLIRHASRGSTTPMRQKPNTDLASVVLSLNKRLVALAKIKKSEGRLMLQPLDSTTVDMSFIWFYTDEEFQTLEKRYRAIATAAEGCLGKDSMEKAEAVSIMQHALEELKERLNTIAQEWVAEQRSFLLPVLSNHSDLTLEDFNLDADTTFRTMEDERFVLLEAYPTKDEEAIERVEEAMRALLRERLDKKLSSYLSKEESEEKEESSEKEETNDQEANEEEPEENPYFFLDPLPDGIPLRCVNFEADEAFQSLYTQYQNVDSPSATEERQNALKSCMNDRVWTLAKEMRQLVRQFLNPEPHGVPLILVPLGGDKIFMAMETDYIKAKHDGTLIEEEKVKWVAALCVRSEELADVELVHLRQFLDQLPEGVPLSSLPLNEDELFHGLETQRFRLKAEEIQNHLDATAELTSLENQMQERVHELARQMLSSEEGNEEAKEPTPSSDPRLLLNDRYEGVELEDLVAFRGPEFQRLWEELCKTFPEEAQHEERKKVLDKFMTRSAVQQLSAERAEHCERPVINGLPFSYLALNEDPALQDGEKKLRHHPHRTEAVEEKWIVQNRMKELADQYLWGHRESYLDPNPEGVPLLFLHLSDDVPFLTIERSFFELNPESMENFEVQALKALEEGVQKPQDRENYAELVSASRRRASELALAVLHRERSEFLPPKILGVPLSVLHESLDKDKSFRLLEVERFRLVNGVDGELRPQPRPDAPPDALHRSEHRARERAEEIAAAVKQTHRAFLHPYTEGAPLEQLGVDSDPDFVELERQYYDFLASKSSRPAGTPSLEEVKEAMAARVHELAYVPPSEPEHVWEDTEFYERNKHVAPLWIPIHELYPGGVSHPPECPVTADFVSEPADASFIAPFLACLARTPALIERLYFPRDHSDNGEPYPFVFFDPSGRAVPVEIDGLIPCTEKRRPVFTSSPTQSWWPLLIEKAYAKYVGGYCRMERCTAGETLRDLTGRPVIQLPLQHKLASELVGCEYKTIDFWREIQRAISEADCVIALSTENPPDGLHPSCLYAVYDVIESVPGSERVEDVLIKVHNAYPDGSIYRGSALSNRGAPQPPSRTHQKAHQEFLTIPFATFIRNMSSLLRCYVNCGDRLTIAAEWEEHSSGGTPKYTTFRENPVFLVENQGDNTVTCLAELRHATPVFYNPDNVGVYHPAALALMRPRDPRAPVSTLLSFNAHEIVQKGVLSDARDATVQIVLPPHSMSYLIPYTKQKASFGRFQLSVYPGEQPILLNRLHAMNSETYQAFSKDIVLQPRTSRQLRPSPKVQVDFAINEPCEVHVLLQQVKVTDTQSVRGGNYLAEDEVTMTVYKGGVERLISTGDASNAREHTLSFNAPQCGRFTVFVSCTSELTTGACPCTLTIFIPQDVRFKFVAPKDLKRRARHQQAKAQVEPPGPKSDHADPSDKHM